MNYIDTLTPEQIKALYTPNQNVLILRKRAKELGSMTDAVSEMASKNEPLRYVAGRLFSVRG